MNGTVVIIVNRAPSCSQQLAHLHSASSNSDRQSSTSQSPPSWREQSTVENGVCYLPSCRFLSEMRTGVAAPREPAGGIRTTEALERISSAGIREQVASM